MLMLTPSDAAALGNTSIIFTAVLARIFLKEQLGVIHFVAITLTITGVIFISKPSFLFGSLTAPASLNGTAFNESLSAAFNETINLTMSAEQKVASLSPEALTVIGTSNLLSIGVRKT